MSTSLTDDDRALRADARRNQDAVLEAARCVFARKGVDASLDEVAKRAGVGRATLYRRFPTREALISAVIDDELDALAGEVGACEPRDAFAHFLGAAAKLLAANRGLMDTLTATTSGCTVALRQRFADLLAPHLARSQAAGGVRPDLTPADGVLILGMLAGAAGQCPGGGAGDEARRALDLLLSAVCPSAMGAGDDAQHAAPPA
jgi:AcrR family transcriptional regulator